MSEDYLKDVPIIDINNKNEIEFNIWSTQSSSDYDNSRDRPYNGQPWTVNGKRGQKLVEGLTMRDIGDCFIKAVLSSYPDEVYFNVEEFSKCWDFSTIPPKPTEYLLTKQKEGKYLSTKVETGNWRPQDLYELDLSKVDPIAIKQNLVCEIEKMMGVFPNIEK